MDKDRVKGTIDDTVGRAERQAGEWTDNPEAQAEGAARQVKGKAEKAWGQVKDAARDARTDADRERKRPVEDDADPEHVGSGSERTQRRP